VLVVDEARREVEAGEAGHLDVEEQHVRRQFVDETQRLDAVAGAPDDTQVRPGAGQLLFQVSQQMRFVVGKQGTDGFDGDTSSKV
jgi:hypothetical protein